MEMCAIPFGTTVWSSITPTEHKGDTGVAHWMIRRRSAPTKSFCLFIATP